MQNGTTVLFLLRRIDCNDGVSSYLETLFSGMNAIGDRIVLVSGNVTAPEQTQPRRRAIEAACEEWIILDDFNPRGADLKNLKRISAIIRRHSVDVISPQGLSTLPFGFALSKLCRKPVVANYLPSIHGVDPSSLKIQTKAGLKKRLSYRLVTGVFAPRKFIAMSKDIVRFFNEDCGVNLRKIVYIVGGIDSDRFRPPLPAERKAARDGLQLSDSTLTCVLTGRLNFNKGHDLVIKAVRELRDSDPNLQIVCLFPGSGADAEAIRSLALTDSADETAFRFLGFVDDDTLLNVYWASDIALLPSRLEGFGLAIAEAMSCGAVPIRTPSGGWEDQIVEGETGFVIPFEDSHTLAKRIHELADNNTRHRMRDATVSHATKYFRKEVMVSKTSELYRRVAQLVG